MFLNELERGNPFEAVDAYRGQGRRIAPARRLERILQNFIRDKDIVLQGAACLFKARRDVSALETLDAALEEHAGAVDIRLRRAEYLAQLNNTKEAVEELQRILDTPEVSKGLVVRAMSQLRRLSPEKFEEARHKPAMQALKWLIGLIDSTAHIPVPPRYALDSHGLLVIHNWQGAIALLEPRVNNPSGFKPIDAFHLAIAYWGKTGELPTDLCKRAIKQYRAQPTSSDSFDLGDLQLLALMYWGAGEKKDALDVLDIVEEACTRYSAEDDTPSLPSFWRNADVSPDQLKDDCYEMRQLIQGKLSFRPPFLEEDHAL